VSYNKQELLTLREHLTSSPVFWWSPCCSSFFFVRCPIMRLDVLRCDVHYDFRIKTMFGLSLHPVVCVRAYLRYLSLLVYSGGVQHILCCVFVLFVFVLCILCCQFLWIVHCRLPLRYSLTFIYNRCMIIVLMNGCFYNGPVICPRSVIMARGGCNGPRQRRGPLQPPRAIITDRGHITGPL